ncbi:hypothetical protein E3N88_17676 [Mikania micrantha]|uniref:Uncharacterized protein n=1 Tax=Mikania micrantha TaxID=192012 RepID=A0A5N6NTZ5_9ASTR|nr:hypothetical protein E3N88_17676 [Mikania micrantha]
MWWDGVWVGRRLDSGVCPIYKHTELDDTGVDNEVKIFLTLMLCKQSDHHDYHSRYRAPGTFRPTGKPDPTPPARGSLQLQQGSARLFVKVREGLGSGHERVRLLGLHGKVRGSSCTMFAPWFGHPTEFLPMKVRETSKVRQWLDGSWLGYRGSPICLTKSRFTNDKVRPYPCPALVVQVRWSPEGFGQTFVSATKLEISSYFLVLLDHTNAWTPRSRDFVEKGRSYGREKSERERSGENGC